MCIQVNKEAKVIAWIIFAAVGVCCLPFMIADFVIYYSVTGDEQICMNQQVVDGDPQTQTMRWFLWVAQWCELVIIIYVLTIAFVGTFLHHQPQMTFSRIAFVLAFMMTLFQITWHIFGIYVYKNVERQLKQDALCQRVFNYMEAYAIVGVLSKFILLSFYLLIPSDQQMKLFQKVIHQGAQNPIQSSGKLSSPQKE